jgi:lysophospholipase L1-like esterase
MAMIQIYILGSSSVYGVGAEAGGWADLVKKALHQKMYGENGVGEKYEVYNFGKAGATIDFVLNNFPRQLEQYGRSGKIISIVSVGGNNAKAEDEPENFVSTIDEYELQMSQLMDLLKDRSNAVIAVGGGFYDEAKVYPKHSPLTGGKSYFSNERKQLFEIKWKEICTDKEIPFVGIEVTEEEWKDNFLYIDGLHPNQGGHRYIAEKVLEVLERYL